MGQTRKGKQRKAAEQSDKPVTLEQLARRSQSDIELDLYERILKRQPNYVEVLKAHAHNLTAQRRYEEGLELDRRLARLRPDDPLVHYNLGCSYSLMGMSEAALAALERSLKLGYRDFDHMLRDTDLEYVRRDARFQRLLRRYRSAKGR